MQKSRQKTAGNAVNPEADAVNVFFFTHKKDSHEYESERPGLLYHQQRMLRHNRYRLLLILRMASGCVAILIF